MCPRVPERITQSFLDKTEDANLRIKVQCRTGRRVKLDTCVRSALVRLDDRSKDLADVSSFNMRNGQAAGDHSNFFQSIGKARFDNVQLPCLRFNRNAAVPENSAPEPEGCKGDQLSGSVMQVCAQATKKTLVESCGSLSRVLFASYQCFIPAGQERQVLDPLLQCSTL
jgi:hypothetical protein